MKSFLFYLAAGIIIIAGLKAGSQILVLFFLSIFLTAILSPLMAFLDKRGLHKIFAFLIVLFLVFLLFLFIGNIMNTSLKSFLLNMPSYEEKIKILILNAIEQLSSYGYTIEPKQIFETLNLSTIFSVTTVTIGNIGNLISKAFLVFLGTAFLLFESAFFEKKLAIIFRSNKDALTHFTLFSTNLKKYFTIKTFTSLLTGLTITITLFLFDIDYPFLWGFLGFILNFIPVIGSLIASLPAIMLSLINNDITTTIWLGIIYFIINVSISNVIEPKFMGRGLGLSPAVVFFSLIFWGWILGPAGMFLAVPLTMTVKIAFESSDKTMWIGLLLSEYPKELKSSRKAAQEASKVKQ